MKNYFALFAELTKFRLSLLATFAAASGYIAINHSLQLNGRFVALVLGSFFVGGGANAYNQFLERSLDAQMLRTKNRVIPRAALSPLVVLICAGISTVIGLIMLYTVQPFACTVAILMWVVYILVYTPLKQKSSLNIFAGSLCGALPPLIGWAGSGKPFSHAAFLLFFQLLVWQIPHFSAIAWNYRKDYKTAGFQMPFLNETFQLKEKILIVVCSGLYLLTTVMFYQVGLCKGVMWWISVIVAILFMGVIFIFIHRPEKMVSKIALSLSIISLSFSYVGLWTHALIP